MNSIKVKAPATVANLSCGFDVLGVCINKPYDEIEVIKIKEPIVKIDVLTSQFDKIPSQPELNTGGVPALKIINDYKLDFGFYIKIKKGIPLSGGLGSSAATASGVVFAINKLLENRFSRKQILEYTLEGEKVSVSNPHADNIAPCLFGGLQLIRSTELLDIIQIPIHNYFFAIIHPDIKINTQDARKLLPKKIDLSSAINQWGNLGSLIYGLSSNDSKIIKKSMKDVIIEPLRSQLINGFYEIQENAMNMGALGCSISGSGPSIFAMSDSEEIATNIVKFSQEFYTSKSLNVDVYISKVNSSGVEVI